MDILPSWPTLSAFLLASLILAVTPGPGVLYIVTRTLAQGRQSGLASVAGVALGNAGNAIAAALGLAALFAVSSLAFTVVKWAGAVYLVYLGVQALRASDAPRDAPAVRAQALSRIFRDGFVVALLNPKTTLFFAAFLPQFMRADAPQLAQSVLLGMLFVGVAAITDSLYALAAETVAPRLRAQRGAARVGRYILGGTFIGLGVMTALTGSRATKA
jgi:threonine/homoserine/homoserine lactone efflux protein